MPTVAPRAMMQLAVLALSFTAAVGHSTTQYRPRRFASAAAYGAIPDDGKDDTLALRRALADCRRSGGAVYIPPGQYIVSHLTAAQGGPLPVATIDILPVPADCHVFGGGREGASRTTVALATTGGADGRGVNGTLSHKMSLSAPLSLFLSLSKIERLHKKGWTAAGGECSAGAATSARGFAPHRHRM